MKKKIAGFTRVELVVVIVIGLMLALWVLPTIFTNRGGTPQRITCINNLKQIGIACRVFAMDHNDLMPALVSVTNGGWSEYLTNGNAGPNCWMNYAAMHLELGESPIVVRCPEDRRKAAATFPGSAVGAAPFFDNMSLSYFVGVGANENFPMSIMGGDRNLCNGTNTANYGFSPDNGTGNDVLISTNPAISKITWSQKMHSTASGTKTPAGNLLLADGSAQRTGTNTPFRIYQADALDSGNFASNAVPKTPSFRLVFP